MSRNTFLKFLCAGVVSAVSFTAANAQGGACRDPWINQVYNQLYHRAPSGTGNSGECNITLYGNGHWSNYNDLMAKVEAVKGAPSSSSLQRPVPAARPAATIAPSSATRGSASPGLAIRPEPENQGRVLGGGIISQDGGGIVAQGGGNMRSLQSVDKPRAPAGKYLVIPGGSLVDANGNVVRAAGTYTIVVKNGANSIGTGGRTPVAGTVVNP